VNDLNKSVTHNENEVAIVSQKKKTPGPDGFTAEFNQTINLKLAKSTRGSGLGSSEEVS
jgi:hypothetical protein